jgi:hypothetical protein
MAEIHWNSSEFGIKGSPCYAHIISVIEYEDYIEPIDAIMQALKTTIEDQYGGEVDSCRQIDIYDNSRPTTMEITMEIKVGKSIDGLIDKCIAELKENRN